MGYYLKKFWKQNALAGVFIIIVSALQVTANLLMMLEFQAIIDRNLNQFILLFTISLGIWFAMIWSDCATTFFEGHAIRTMNNAVRQDIVAGLTQKNYRELQATTTGEHLSQFTNDINQMETLAWKPFFTCIQTISGVVLSAAALLTLHGSLLIASLIVALIMFFVPRLFNKRMETLGRVCSEEQARATSILKDLLSGYNVLRSFGRMMRFCQESQSASDQIEHAKFRLVYIKGIVGSGVNCVNLACQALLNGLIALLSIKGIILQGALMGGGNLCGSLSNGLGTVAELLLSFSTAKPYFEKIAIHADEIRSAPQDEIQPFDTAITLKNVTFCYDQTPIVKDVSFHFDKGGKYALVGPSGCGKTTVLKLLLGWLPDYTGSIQFDGIDAHVLSPDQLQQQISYIDQDVFLFNTTILDNITLGEDFTEKQLQSALKKSALETDLASMSDGLDTVVGENGANLSGGQRQRIAIARALIHNRCILLIDEGTSALDRKNADIIEKNLLADRDLTLIMVSHHIHPEQEKQFTQIYEVGAVAGSLGTS